MSSPAKTPPSPAELAKLEHAFATDPASDAYLPLAEAYLGMGRFMEAMVVCKKGVKAHPDRVDPRILLARVYAEQGKEKKALEELQGALQVSPNDKGVLRMAGSLQLKSGEADAGRANLLKAYEADPADTETTAALAQWKIDPPKKAPPPPVDPPTERVAVSAAPVAGPGTSRPGAAAKPHVNGTGSGAPRPTGSRPAVAPQGSAPPRATGSRPAMAGSAPPRSSGSLAPRPTGSRAPVRAYDEDEEEVEAPRVSRGQRARARGFMVLLGALTVGIVGYFGWGQWHAMHVRAFNAAKAKALTALSTDSYQSYQDACKWAETALENDSSNASAHGILAYAYAIRWGEHGGGEDAHRQALDQLKAALDSGEPDARTFAAQALIKSFSGQNADAIADLEQKIDELHQDNPLLYSTLGVLQMNAGDYEHALDNLNKAQQLASSDPRIYAELGNLYRRRGEDKLAWKNFDFALRYQPNHPEAMLGKAMIIMNQEKPAFYEQAAALLKKLTDGNPPPSPRQLAEAYLARALLIAKVESALGQLKSDDVQRLLQLTSIPADATAARQEMIKDEGDGFALDRGNADLHLMKARRLLTEKNVDQAAAEVREAIKADNTRPQYYVELVNILLSQPNGAAEAEHVLNAARDVVSHSPRLMFLLGEAFRLQGNQVAALQQFRQAVADPKSKNPDAHIAMGHIFLERRDYKGAEAELTKAARDLITQPTKLAQVQTDLGRVYEAERDRFKADDAFKQALNADGEYADAYFWYAQFLAGDSQQRGKARLTAIEYLKREPSGSFAAQAKALAQGR